MNGITAWFGITVVTIGLAVVLAGIVGFGFAQVRFKPPLRQASAVSTATWATYTNYEYGFSLRYPSTLRIQEETRGVFTTTLFSLRIEPRRRPLVPARRAVVTGIADGFVVRNEAAELDRHLVVRRTWTGGRLPFLTSLWSGVEYVIETEHGAMVIVGGRQFDPAQAAVLEAIVASVRLT